MAQLFFIRAFSMVLSYMWKVKIQISADTLCYRMRSFFGRQCLLNKEFGITDPITLFYRKSPQVKSTFRWICPGYWAVPVQFMQ